MIVLTVLTLVRVSTVMKVTTEKSVWTEMTSYRTTDPFEADFGEFWDTLFLAKVCLEH